MRMDKLVFSIVLVLTMIVSVSAKADTDDALAEIVATVHGVTSQAIEGDTLNVKVMNIGADYDFMALVACRLLDKHKVEGIQTVVLYDSEETDKILGQFSCTKKVEGEDTKVEGEDTK